MADGGWVAPGTEGGLGPFDGWAGPYAPPPPPPSRGNVRLRVVFGLLAIAALVTVTVLVALMLPSNEGGDSASEPATGNPADFDLVAFRDPQGAYQISVPEGWVSASLEGDISDVGEQTFPDDPDRAREFQRRMDSVPRAVVFVSLDPDETQPGGFTSNLIIVRIPGATESDIDENVDDLRRTVLASGGDVVEEGPFETATGETTRLEYEGTGPVSGISYVAAAGGDVWALTFSTNQLSAEGAMSDAVAATFAPGG